MEAVGSRHPQNRPGLAQFELDEELDDSVELVAVGVGSLHPNHPGVLHVVLLEDDVVGMKVVKIVVMVRVAEGEAEGMDEVVVGSLQPNHPGVLQVLVVVVSEVVPVAVVVVVVLSRHPHHPGVSHVDVRVRIGDVVELLDVVGCEPLLLKNFHSEQSRQAVSRAQIGTLSYFSMTSLITLRIR